MKILPVGARRKGARRGRERGRDSLEPRRAAPAGRTCNIRFAKESALSRDFINETSRLND
jgi:hypothetical protein